MKKITLFFVVIMTLAVLPCLYGCGPGLLGDDDVEIIGAIN